MSKFLKEFSLYLQSKINIDELDQAMKTSASGSEVMGEAVESDEEVVFHNTAPSSSYKLFNNLNGTVI